MRSSNVFNRAHRNGYDCYVAPLCAGSAIAIGWARALSIGRPIRVLHLRDSPWIDGPGRTVLETARHMDPARIEYHIGAFLVGDNTVHPLIETARNEGLRVHEIADSRGLSRALIERVTSLLERHEIDILHTSEFRSNVLGLMCRHRHRGIRIKLVTTAHGWIANDFRGRVYRVIDKLLLAKFDAVILVSEAMRNLLPGFIARSGRVHTVRNALVLGRYGAGVRRNPVNVDDSDVRILNVGRLSPEKGQLLLLEAFAKALPTFPRMRLLFAGTGPLESRLRASATDLGIAERVEFLGYVEDMPSAYAQSALVVQSSLTEGMPNVILEAAYLKVPIIATDVGGTREVIEHGVSGWLVPPGSIDALATALGAYCRDPARFEAMAQHANTEFASRFSFSARTEAVTKIYEQLVA